MNKLSSSEMLQQFHQIWQTDSKYVEEIEDGFHWWPGHHKVTVRCTPKGDHSDPDAWRLTVSTAFLKGVSFEDPKIAGLIPSLGSFSASYGWVYTPPEVSRKFELPADGAIAFYSSVYVRPQTADWLPVFFARIAIMQPIDAERLSAQMSEMLKGEADRSGVRQAVGSSANDDILNVAQEIFVPIGQEPSKWAGSEEFKTIAERFGRSDTCFGNGGPEGTVLEIPFGKSSSLIRLHHDIKHPGLGTGLLGTIRVPVFEGLEASTATCIWLNYFGSIMWTDGPVLGTWHPQEIQEGRYSPSYGVFVPNALHADGIATNVALWNLMLARWARVKVWPDLQDVSMSEIIGSRMNQLVADVQNT